MKFRNLLTSLVLSVSASFILVGNAQALSLTPEMCDDASEIGVTCWTTTDSSNPDANAIETLVGFTGDLTLQYKANVDGGEEGSPFDPSYETTFTNSSSDPMDATITYQGNFLGSISCPTCYLSIKDGNSNPALYVFDISAWNGTDAIEMTGFWPNTGAISNVAIWTGEGGTGPNCQPGDPSCGTIPEPQSLMLIGFGLIGMYAARRRVGADK